MCSAVMTKHETTTQKTISHSMTVGDFNVDSQSTHDWSKKTLRKM